MTVTHSMAWETGIIVLPAPTEISPFSLLTAPGQKTADQSGEAWTGTENPGFNKLAQGFLCDFPSTQF